jgi:hypothetical protein
VIDSSSVLLTSGSVIRLKAAKAPFAIYPHSGAAARFSETWKYTLLTALLIKVAILENRAKGKRHLGT